MAREYSIDIPDLHGTLAVVTGASDGIGHVIATRLAQAGAELVLPVRSATKGEGAADRIRAAAPGATVHLRELDLASLDSVAAFADGMVAEGRPVDILINNAGVMRPPAERRTVDGFEIQWGTNHLGHFALTLGMLPVLQAGKARVTHQTSVAARMGRINWDDLNWKKHYDGGRAYVQSKIAVGLFARELDRRSRAEGWGISSNISHPGVSPTNLLGPQPGMGRTGDAPQMRRVRRLSRLGIAGTAQSAALPALMAATGRESKGDEFYGPRRFMGGPPARLTLWPPFRDMDDARRIWTESTAIVGARFAV